MKILPKGLILVAVPLVFGIVFIASLFWGISEVNRLILRELMVKDSIITYVTEARCSVCAVRYNAVFRSTRDQRWKKRAQFNERLTEEAKTHIKNLLQADPTLPIPTLENSKDQLQLFAPGSNFAQDLAELGKIVLGQQQVDLGRLSTLTRPLQDVYDVETEEAIEAMSFLRAILYNGIYAEIAVSVLLTIFFCVSITNGLKKTLANTINLSTGQKLNPPLLGPDEIAELDRFLFDAATKIRDLERFKRDMTSIVGKELKSPLYSVGSYLSAVRDGVYGKLDQKSTDRVAKSCTSVKRLIELIADLFLLDRADFQLALEAVPIAELISASVDTVKELLEKSGIRIVIEGGEGAVVADRDRLIQVLVNLLSNAMKFSPKAGQITIKTTRDDQWTECRIIDQGPGIPKLLQKQIFEPFKQADAKDEVAKKGTGLGLTIARTIIDQHQGTIGIDSEEGNGSSFWFRIPTNGPSPTNQPASGLANQAQSRTSESARKAIKIPKMKFSVLRQGLLIISVPLIFTILFVPMLAGLLEEINAHNNREEVSQKLLLSVNQSGDDLLDAIRFAMVYMYTRNKDYWDLFTAGIAKSIEKIDQSQKLIADEPEQIKDLQICRSALVEFPGFVERESARLGRIYGKGKTGAFGSMAEFEDLVRNPEHVPDSFLKKVHTLIYDNSHIRSYEPFVDAQDAQERIMAREKFTGERLAAQREQMMHTLNLMLLAGIVVTTILSILLDIFLVRNLISRVRHVMENTARILRRDPLEMPQTGTDEIEYLDRVLCETGNQLNELEAFKHSLVAIVSHELRTPLTAVCLTLELMSAGVFGGLSDEGLEKLKETEEEARNLVRLITDLLDLEKMAAGKFVLDKIQFKIGELMDRTTDSVLLLAESKQINLEVDNSSDQEVLTADRDRLRQALVNILSNRIRTLPQESTVNLMVQCKPIEVEFRVVDHGGGIPNELKEKIFDRFVQVDTPDGNELSGAGLTFAITKAIVEQHGGTIGVESQIGSGSTFWVRLPVDPVKVV
jgi:signal transduction histidine kinase